MDNKPSVRKQGLRLGKSGTTIISGRITNEEYNARMQGKSGLRTIEVMRKSDPTIRSTLQVVKLPIKQADWHIKKYEDDEEMSYRARFIENELFHSDVDFNKFLNEVLTCLDFGHSVFEKTLKITEFEKKTRVGIKELGWRKQTTIEKWEIADGVAGIEQRTLDGDSALIPRDKLMYFVFDQEGDNTMGVSVLRYVFKAWDLKDKMELINGIGLERHAVGVPIVEIDENMSDTEIAKIDEIMRQFRANEEGYIRKPKNTSVEMMDMKSDKTKDPMPTIKYYDRQIQVSVLAQFLSLGGSDASGSRAVSDDQSKLFLMSEQALAKMIQTVIQRELIKPLCDLNFSDNSMGYPQIEFGTIGDENVLQLGEYVSKLMGAGAIEYDPVIENHLRKVGGLPTLSEDEIKEKKLKHEDEEMQSKKTPTEKPIDPKVEKDLKTEAALAEARRVRSNLIDIVKG